MALGRGTSDAVLKRRYEDLALEFAQNAGSERDLDITIPPLLIAASTTSRATKASMSVCSSRSRSFASHSKHSTRHSMAGKKHC
jgi:hypothetical protein